MAPDPDDASLMLRYRDGDASAFDALYARHKGPLYRYLRRQCRHDATADELFQEVWTRIIAARHRYLPSARFTTWMYLIAHNCYVDQLRRELRRAETAMAEPLDPEQVATEARDEPEQLASGQQQAARLREALDRLPPEQREAILLREEAGLSLEDIAAVTGVSTETAKSRLRYGITKLRATLTGAIQ
jgi:RNA polymerase sigma-70 factor (ECF subfamily)